MDKTVCIYMIVNIINGNAYIGQTTDYDARKRNHEAQLSRDMHHNDYLQNAWNKYGPGVFTFEIIETCSAEQLNDKEKYYIENYKTFNDSGGYNLITGGAKYRKHSRYVRNKISKKLKGRKFSDLHRERA